MTLSELWFGLIAVVWAGFFVLEGFDFGVGMLHPVLGRDEPGRRAMINTIGPVWDGNEVWLITAGAAMFAAFPGWYATMFSAFYLALLVLLAALIARGISFEYRGKRDGGRWRGTFSGLMTAGSLLAPLLIGVALGDLLVGLPVNGAQDYTGSFWTLLRPYGLLAGVTLVVLCLAHGATFAACKTTFELRARAVRFARALAPVALVLLAALVVWTSSVTGHGLVPSPIGLVAVVAMAVAVGLIAADRDGWAFVATAITVAFTIINFFTEIYPKVMVSSTSPAFSLTISNTASGPYTLKVMTIVVAIFLPVVLAYTAWTYYVFRRRLSDADFRPPALNAPAAPAGAAGPLAVSGPGSSRPVPAGGGRHRRSRHG